MLAKEQQTMVLILRYCINVLV